MTEIRIAAVMNGGISLAVWMGGVTHELDRVRLASLDREPTDEKERAVHRAWKAVLEHAGKVVVVDTVAGTSAGGLNGTLLATAIAHGGHLGSLRDVWLSKASLESAKLLRADPEGAPTLLDGTYFTNCINGALAEVVESGTGEEEESAGEVTLLVTATAIGAPTPTVRLEGGREDSYRDSRRVFRFRRRLGRDGGPDENALLAPDPKTVPTGEPSGPLARAARASASFPVAFEPVMEDESLREQRVSPPLGDDEHDLPLMDGGVLDNAPFGPVLDALRQRPVGAPFERVLLYVVPSVSARRSPQALAEADLPDVGRVLAAAYSSLGEPDQRLDMEALVESFRRMSFQKTAPHAVLADALEGDHAALATTAAALFDVYRRGRAEAFHRWIMGVGEPADLRRPDAIEPDPDDIPVVPPADDPPRWAGQPWLWGASTAERVLRWLGRALVRVSSGADPGSDADLADAFRALDAAQRRVRELVETMTGREVTDRLKALQGYEARLAHVNDAVYTDRMTAQLGAAVGSAADAIAGWLSTSGAGTAGAAPTGADVLAAALHVEVVSSALSWGADSGDTPRFTYRQVSPAAPPLPGLPGGPHGPSAPDDWAAKKLYGERWGHFGAFATMAGRTHDWLWGRLDGAASLLELLLGPDYLSSPLTGELVRAILAAEIAVDQDTSDPDAARRDAVAAGAKRVAAMKAGDLYRFMLEEPGGEDRRELLLATVPEVVRRVEALPPGVAQVVRVLMDQAETAADVHDWVERVSSVWRRLRGTEEGEGS